MKLPLLNTDAVLYVFSNRALCSNWAYTLPAQPARRCHACGAPPCTARAHANAQCARAQTRIRAGVPQEESPPGYVNALRVRHPLPPIFPARHVRQIGGLNDIFLLFRLFPTFRV
jgi:hypothetical protein